MVLPFPCPLREAEIVAKRKTILNNLIPIDSGFARTPVRSIRLSTLYTMKQAYDQSFFGGYLATHYRKFEMTFSTRMTSAAGKFIYNTRNKDAGEIRMSGDFLFRLQDGPFTLNGLTVPTAQEAFLVVFEHELIHAVEFGLFNSTGHSQRFLQFAHGMFGHTRMTHELPTRKDDARSKGIAVGSTVTFEYEGRKLTGIVSYVGKTATVMVPNAKGSFTDAKGRKYAKYRVSLPLLQAE